MTIFENKELIVSLRRVGMKCNFSWENSAKKYLEVYKEIINAS